MTPGTHRPRGVTVIDAIALVMGGAVASVHVRGRLLEDASAGAGAFLALGFAGLSLTAAGPFLLASRALAGWPTPRGPAGTWCWAALGGPWVAGGIVQAIAPGHELRWVLLVAGMTPAVFFVVIHVWLHWVRTRTAEAAGARTRFAHWTDAVGLVLAVAWPLQLSLLLMFGASN